MRRTGTVYNLRTWINRQSRFRHVYVENVDCPAAGVFVDRILKLAYEPLTFDRSQRQNVTVVFETRTGTFRISATIRKRLRPKIGFL